MRELSAGEARGARRHKLAAAAGVGQAALFLGLGVAALTAPLETTEAAFPGANGRIAFSSNMVTAGNPTGDFEIFTMNPDGSDLAQLTDNTESDRFPAWSPDGTSILFMSTRDGGNAEIYSMTGAGEFQLRVTYNNAVDNTPTWSPNGKRLAFVSYRDGNFEVYRMKVGAENPVDNPPVNLSNNPASDGSPAWSPKGKIAFNSDRGGDYEIFTMTPNGSNQTNRTKNQLTDIKPNWSPDGTRIAFESAFGILTMKAGGGDLRNLTEDHPATGSDPAWSPNGRRIAFLSGTASDPEIFTMRADGSKRRNRTKNDALEDEAPDWGRIPDAR